MRLLVLIAAVLAAGCGSAPAPVQQAVPDDTSTEAYRQAVAQLASMDRQAEKLFHDGKADEASALITRAEPLAGRVVAVPRPTLEAMAAASDLDDLYGRMLLANHNYGWARLEFQKNLARWKSWKPRTPDTEQRLKQAQDAIAECDRRMAE